MKISELLLEYRRDITQQKLAKELDQIASNERTTPEDVLVNVESIDPTKNKQYVLWLVKQLAKKQFRLEDAPRVTELLNNFISVKNRLPLEQRDIGRFDFYRLDGLIDKTMNVELETGTATSNGTFPVVPDSKVLYNGPLGQLAIPETEEASCELGRGTKWCTAAEKNNMFSEYSQYAPLYIWRDKSGEKYQFHFGGSSYDGPQFMDARDRPIDEKTMEHFKVQHPVISKLFNRYEAELLSARNPYRLADYAKTVIGGRWPEAEPVIMKDPDACVYYAGDVINGRWPEAEPVIMKDPAIAVKYAYSVIRGRWPEAEPVIMKDADAASTYSMMTAGRWPEAEPVIMKDPDAALTYAERVLRRRWPEAEPVISTDRYAWQQYTRRFPAAISD